MKVNDFKLMEEKWVFVSFLGKEWIFSHRMNVFLILLRFILTGCSMPVALSAFLFTAVAWGKGIFVCFALIWHFLYLVHIDLTIFFVCFTFIWQLCTFILSFVTSFGREADRGTWNLTFPDSSEVTLWHLVSHKLMSFVLNQECYDHITMLHIMDIIV